MSRIHLGMKSCRPIMGRAFRPRLFEREKREFLQMKRIKLLVVDDSILFREILARYIRRDEMIDVVGMAGDAYAARDLILKCDPDVMTLDVEMPRMDGIAFLKKLLPQYYVPTIIVSSLPDKRAAAAEAGALEFIQKPLTRTSLDMEKFAEQLCVSIKRAYAKKPALVKQAPMQSAVVAAKPAAAPSTIRTARLRKSDALIALGASTGGTEALEQVVRAFPEDTPPVLIVQHMPAGFTKLYADRLNRSCRMEVKEAEDGDRLRRGLVIVGAGENHLRLCKDRQGWYVSSKPGDKVSGHCPSVDVLFTSVSEVAGANAIGAIFTGMGKDGAEGLLKMRNSGAFTVGQDKESCVVYGMPMEAFNIGAVEVQAPLYNIAEIILNQLY